MGTSVAINRFGILMIVDCRARTLFAAMTFFRSLRAKRSNQQAENPHDSGFIIRLIAAHSNERSQ